MVHRGLHERRIGDTLFRGCHRCRVDDLSRHRRAIVRIFSCALAVDAMFTVMPWLHNEPLTGGGHWALAVILAAGAGMLASVAGNTIQQTS